MEMAESDLPPLWEIFRANNDPQNNTVLTCDQCFAIMEYLADCAVAGSKREAIFAAAQKHLARCPDCRMEHTRRIEELAKLSDASKG